MLILNDRDVRELLDHAAARRAVRDGAAAYSAGSALVPDRIRMQVAQAGSEMLVMPGYLPDSGVLGLKLVSVYPGNLARGLPTTPAQVITLDPDTGLPAALIAGTFLTLIRTAAMSVVAAEYLAIPEPTVLGIIGAGGQAESHIDAFLDRFPLRTVRLHSRTTARAHELMTSASQRHPGVEFVVPGAAEAVCEGADIVIAATTSRTPVVPAEAVGSGQLVIGIGSHSADAVELDIETVAAADRIVVDTRAGSLDVAADISQAYPRVEPASVAELGELIAGNRLGRQSDQELTIFKSAGFAALDLAAAGILLRLALERSRGIQIDL